MHSNPGRLFRVKLTSPEIIFPNGSTKLPLIITRGYRALAHRNIKRVNEINTVPGSLAYYLFEGKYTLETLTRKLIELAKKHRREKDALVYTYKSDRMPSPKK